MVINYYSHCYRNNGFIFICTHVLVGVFSPLKKEKKNKFLYPMLTTHIGILSSHLFLPLLNYDAAPGDHPQTRKPPAVVLWETKGETTY